jgi:RimJ/RimL family protein N-acetyltransferase
MPLITSGTWNIRKAEVDDAEALVSFFERLDREANFMLYEPGERNLTAEQQAKRLASLENSSSGAMFVAKVAGEIIGFVAGVGGTANRNRHSVHIVIGILEAFCGRGIGPALMETLESWAVEHCFHRLELTVMTHNSRAIALYKKRGFEEEGIKRHSLLVNGEYENELYMAKLL